MLITREELRAYLNGEYDDPEDHPDYNKLDDGEALVFVMATIIFGSIAIVESIRWASAFFY